MVTANNATLQVTVTNPEPIGCERKAPIYVVDPPTIQTMIPAVLFSDLASQTATIKGSNFIVLDGVPPKITFETAQGEVVATATDVTWDKCMRKNEMDRGVDICSQLDFTLPKGATRESGLLLVVTPPEPISTQCRATLDTALLKAPVIDRVSSELICNGDDFSFIGRFYQLTLDSFNPSGDLTLAVNGNPLDKALLVADGCTSLVVNPFVKVRVFLFLCALCSCIDFAF